MHIHYQTLILKLLELNPFCNEVIQSLWRGDGKIVRYGLIGSKINSVVVKHMDLSGQG
jgi:hypothetical protein